MQGRLLFCPTFLMLSEQDKNRERKIAVFHFSTSNNRNIRDSFLNAHSCTPLPMTNMTYGYSKFCISTTKGEVRDENCFSICNSLSLPLHWIKMFSLLTKFFTSLLYFLKPPVLLKIFHGGVRYKTRCHCSHGCSIH